jgi:hypothetical protein
VVDSRNQVAKAVDEHSVKTFEEAEGSGGIIEGLEEQGEAKLPTTLVGDDLMRLVRYESKRPIQHVKGDKLEMDQARCSGA